jgi:copper homeostasis protein
VLLEACITTLDDARAAHLGGADRIELCAALELDGLTPSLGALLEIQSAVPLPVAFMLRPRAGGFVYTDAEMLVMGRDADLAVAHGASALVFGCLKADGTVDVPRARALIGRAGKMPVVFHRAFDRAPDLFAALETLIDLGVTRVLTSGGHRTAAAGADVIRQLIARAAGRIEVLPGGGITPENAAGLIARTGATQLHGSFSADTPSGRRTSAARVAAARVALRGG